MSTSAVKWRATSGYYGLYICLGLGMGIFGPTIPDVALQVGSPAEVLGVLGLVGSIGYTVGTFLGGRLFDRVARGHALLGAAELVAAGLLAAYPLARSFWILVAIVLLRGVLEGMVNTGTNTLLLWTHGDKASPFMNGLHFCFGVGASLSPFVVGRCFSWGVGYRAAYWTVAGFAALASLWMLVSPGSPDPREHVARAARAGNGAGVIRWAPVLLAALYLFAYVGGEISFGTWISTYALWLQVADKAAAAYLASVFWFAFTVGRLISIPAALRFTPRQVIPAALVPCLVIAAAMMAFPAPDYRTLLLAAAALGFCLAPLWPTGFTLAGQVIPMTAFASGLVLLGDSLGGAVLPSSAGWIMTRMQGGGPRLLSLSMPMLMFGSLVVVGLAYLALIAVSGRRAGAGARPGVAGLLPALQPDEGRVYFMRKSSMLGAAVQPDIYLDGKVVGSSKPGGFFYVDAKAGPHEASATTEAKRALSFSLDAGETKYVRSFPTFGILIGRVNFELVNDAEAEKELDELSYTGQPPAAKPAEDKGEKPAVPGA